MDPGPGKALSNTDTRPEAAALLRAPKPPQRQRHTQAAPRRGQRLTGWRRASSPSSLDVVTVLASGLLAAALSIYDMTARSLGFDEAATATIAQQHGHALGAAIAHDGGNMSGYYVLMHALVGAFGKGLVVLRLPSAIAIAVAVALTAWFALRLFGRMTGLVAGLLTAVTVSLVYWGQGARSYGLLVAFVAGSFLAFAALVEAPDEVANDIRSATWRARGAWAAWIFLSALAMYMSLMAGLALVAQLVTFAWWWRRRGLAVLAGIVTIAILSIPLFLLAAGRGTGQLFWAAHPALVDIEQVGQALTGAGLEPNIHATATTSALLWLTGAGLLAIALAVAYAVRTKGPTRLTFGPVLILSWLVVPVVLAWGESQLAQPLFLPRNLLYCAPAAALLLAWGITRRRVAIPLAVACVAALLALRALQVAPSYGVSPEDWHGATAFVLGHARTGDCTIFYPADGRMAFRYYLPTTASRSPRAGVALPRPLLPSAPWNNGRTYVEDYAVPPASTLARLHSSCSRVWFISTHQGHRTGSPGSRSNYRRYIALRASLEGAYPRASVRLFGYASAVRVELLSG